MGKNFLIIPLRYLFSNQKNSTIRSMITICFGGIFVATFALALVVSIMEGFEQETYKKMQTIYPDLILEANGREIDLNKLAPILKEEKYDIKQISAQRTAQVLLLNPELDSQPTVIFLRGIDPKKEMAVTALKEKVLKNCSDSDLEKIIKKNQILIGQKLAENLSISNGDEIKLLYSDNETNQLKVTFEQENINVGGLFKVGIDEFDNNLAYCSIELFDKLFENRGITEIYLKLKSKQNEEATIRDLSSRLNLNVYSWQKLYPALISTLKLEKYVMFFILLLIVFIASMNIISLIFMFITQKKREIALLISFGMPLSKIKMIFMMITIIISTISTITGLSIAYLSGIILQWYHFIKLPDDIYIVSHLPVELNPLNFFIIFISSLAITLFASMLSTKKLKNINIIQALKYD